MLCHGVRNAAATPTSHKTSSVALVTGAASGIGRAFAAALARRGNPLILVDRAADPLCELADQLRSQHLVQVHPLVLDLSHPQTVGAVLDFCRNQNMRVDVLVNNAGVGARSRFAYHKMHAIEEMINVNVTAILWLTRLLLPSMIRARHGTIINVSSTAAFERMPDLAVYGATKAFTLSFTESLQDELAGTGVFATAVCPGVTKTPFLEKLGIDPDQVPAALTAERVVEEALRGIERQKLLIVTGLANRLRVLAQRTSLRGLLRSVKHRARQLRLIA
jgi:short-subunit dehydrogenase